jgi:DNA mismatch endonuclease (patch repair protein)
MRCSCCAISSALAICGSLLWFSPRDHAIPVLRVGRNLRVPRGSMKAAHYKVDPITTRRMAAVPSRNTSAELRVRELLRAAGITYRVSNGDLPGSPDVANRSRKWALFVHGCFWHAHRGCRHAMVPKSNVLYWVKKFADNAARDRHAVAALRAQRYAVLTIWQCELREPERALRRLEKFFVRAQGRDNRFSNRLREKRRH